MKAVNNINYVWNKLNNTEKEIYNIFKEIKNDLIFLLQKPNYNLNEIKNIIIKINYLYKNWKTSKKLKNIIKTEINHI